MTDKTQTTKWITVGLGVVCLVLVVNLLFRGSHRTSSAKGGTPTARPSAAAPVRSAAVRAAEELAQYDPAVRVEQFKEIQGWKETKIQRNPFEFVARAAAAQAQQETAAAAPAAQAAPPPPPPPPLKAVGYTEKGGGVGEAFVTFQDELFVVHEGETFAQRFRVAKLSPTHVEVIDGTTQKNIRLPIGQ